MKILKRIFIWCRNLLIVLFLFSIAAVTVYKYVPVYYTPLMFIRLHEKKAKEIKHEWVSLSKISQPVIQAVVASEDNRFMEHHGFDHEQIRKAIDDAQNGRRIRGASTISQQTAKNVFLWPGKNLFRKGLEVYFTLLTEWIWGKKRIMEVYLNSIEMGQGIYGIEAAAQVYFDKHAWQLTRNEAALLAAILPNPLARNPLKPSPYIQKRQADILSLMRKIETVDMGYRNSK
ncbi:MAG: monofunctional biosynthetic peptidoglycan transglycosylase [Tannerella sp.]|jgi:monofunctional biosynthetic peptidoglycan transglycosylase|nr:monofunctional biosynthetic peptidoglycan transglycosylase [Tannerella sp.]